MPKLKLGNNWWHSWSTKRKHKIKSVIKQNDSSDQSFSRFYSMKNWERNFLLSPGWGRFSPRHFFMFPLTVCQNRFLSTFQWYQCLLAACFHCITIQLFSCFNLNVNRSTQEQTLNGNRWMSLAWNLDLRGGSSGLPW